MREVKEWRGGMRERERGSGERWYERERERRMWMGGMGCTSDRIVLYCIVFSLILDHDAMLHKCR